MSDNTRHSVRLKAYDYSSNGAYFVTICTQNRDCLFGTITVGAGPCACPHLILSGAGEMVIRLWYEIPIHYPGIGVDKFAVMPNHIHGIIVIEKNGIVEQPGIPGGQTQGFAPTTASISLPEIVQRFKTLTTKFYSDGVKRTDWRPFRGKLWQRGYYEHVIRNEDELNEIRQYILTNPLKWALDNENPEHRG